MLQRGAARHGAPRGIRRERRNQVLDDKRIAKELAKSKKVRKNVGRSTDIEFENVRIVRKGVGTIGDCRKR